MISHRRFVLIVVCLFVWIEYVLRYTTGTGLPVHVHVHLSQHYSYVRP